jgi:hypothetical protein
MDRSRPPKQQPVVAQTPRKLSPDQKCDEIAPLHSIHLIGSFLLEKTFSTIGANF